MPQLKNNFLDATKFHEIVDNFTKTQNHNLKDKFSIGGIVYTKDSFNYEGEFVTSKNSTSNITALLAKINNKK